MPRAKKNEPNSTGAKRGRPSKKQLAEQQAEQEKQFDTTIIEEPHDLEETVVQEQTQEDTPTAEEIAPEEAVPTEDTELEQTQEEASATQEIAPEEAVPTEDAELEQAQEETSATEEIALEEAVATEDAELEKTQEDTPTAEEIAPEETIPTEDAELEQTQDNTSATEESVLEEQPPVQQQTATETPVDDPTVQGQLNPPMKIEVAMRGVKPEGKVRATANLTIADCLLIRNVKLMESRAGELYASMPKYTSSQNPQMKYNHCKALTDDFKEQLNSAMTEAYEQILSQQQSSENTVEQSMDAPDGGMTMNM